MECKISADREESTYIPTHWLVTALCARCGMRHYAWILTTIILFQLELLAPESDLQKPSMTLSGDSCMELIGLSTSILQQRNEHCANQCGLTRT